MLLDQINDDFKQAMRAKDELAVSALRNLKSEIKNAEIEKKGQPLADPEVLKVVSRKVKQHKDSIDSFAAGNRPDLVEHERKQMEVLSRYLPKQLSEDEVRALVAQVISETGAGGAQFGQVMKEVLARAGGAADGSIVSRIAKEELSK